MPGLFSGEINNQDRSSLSWSPDKNNGQPAYWGVLLAGDRRGCVQNIVLGYVSAVCMHGFYDACAMMGTGLSTLVFLAFVVIMYIVILRLIRNESATDAPIE